MKKIAILKEMIQVHEENIVLLKKKKEEQSCEILKGFFDHLIRLREDSIKDFNRLIQNLQKKSIIAKF